MTLLSGDITAVSAMLHPTRSPRHNHALALIATAADELNSELTILLSSAQSAVRAIGPGEPGRDEVLAIMSASQRLAWMASTLVNYAERNGGKACASTVQRMVAR